ncbi:MAG: DUF5997 family protein [Microbacteriaceae bacterium]
MSTEHAPQTMKPATAAQKLGVYLPATPEEFQANTHTRAELDALNATPPEWLVELRKNGPHPRPVVAGKLGISIAGLARGEVTDALTSAEILSLLQAPPKWLVQERATQAEVRDEKQRIKERDAWRREQAAKNDLDDGHAPRARNQPRQGGR